MRTRIRGGAGVANQRFVFQIISGLFWELQFFVRPYDLWFWRLYVIIFRELETLSFGAGALQPYQKRPPIFWGED